MNRYTLLLALFTATAALADDANCIAYEAGTSTVIARDTATTSMDCSKRMMAAVKEARCGGIKGAAFKYEVTLPKFGDKRTPQQVYCKK